MKSVFFMRIKRCIKYLLMALYRVVNILIFPFLNHCFLRSSEKNKESRQLFLMTRLDFGTFLFLLHYVKLWQISRSKTCVVVLTAYAKEVRSLVDLICPEAELIIFDNLFSRLLVFIFRKEIVQFLTYNKIYANFLARWPNALFIYDQPFSLSLKESVSSYISHFDEHVVSSFSRSPFILAYLNVREILDYRVHVFNDMIRIHTNFQLNNVSFFSKQPMLCNEIAALGRYVVINLNIKDYGNKDQNRRAIRFSERYNALIDFLIESDYNVVIQGRKEQPCFSKRKGLLDYSRSNIASVENDIEIYSHCEFAVTSKTGAEIFGTVCNIPVLGLNYTELSSMQPNIRFRFFPKYLYNLKEGRYLSWEEMLLDPSFFDMGKRSYNADIEYREIGKEDMIRAAEEFIKLLPLSMEKWRCYTAEQKKFREKITPLHLDLFHISGVPCQKFLEATSSGQNNRENQRNAFSHCSQL